MAGKHARFLHTVDKFSLVVADLVASNDSVCLKRKWPTQVQGRKWRHNKCQQTRWTGHWNLNEEKELNAFMASRGGERGAKQHVPPWSVCADTTEVLLGPSPAALKASMVNEYSVNIRSDVTTVDSASPVTVTSWDVFVPKLDSQKKICKQTKYFSLKINI